MYYLRKTKKINQCKPQSGVSLKEQPTPWSCRRNSIFYQRWRFILHNVTFENAVIHIANIMFSNQSVVGWLIFFWNVFFDCLDTRLRIFTVNLIFFWIDKIYIFRTCSFFSELGSKLHYKKIVNRNVLNINIHNS